MRRTTELAPVSALAFAVIALAARGAMAEPKDAKAQQLAADAMAKDYLDTKFDSAEKKLRRALALCGDSGCSLKVLARIHRDLATVEIAGLGKLQEGKADLVEALKDDPSITLDSDYVTPAIEQAFKEVKAGSAPQKSPDEGSSGVEHAPVTEQALKTPIPIFARWRGEEAAAKLIVRFQGIGEKRWRSAPMAKSGEGHAAEIPCDAATSEGQLLYYIEAADENGSIVGRDGSRANPHAVTIRAEIEGEAPHLPDAPPPARCKEVCVGDGCEGKKPDSGPTNNWFSASLQQDFAIVEGENDVCTLESQTSGHYSCFRAQGSQYHGTPVLGNNDNVNGGLAAATTRLILGYDRVLIAGLTVGLHLGFVLRGGGPRADGADVHPFLPIHVEGRASYFFGADVFSTSGFRPFVFLSGGAAQVDRRFTVIVREDRSHPPPPSQIDNPSQQVLSAYRRMGQGFMGLGGGLMFAFTKRVGLSLGLRYMRMFPTPGNVIAPELGFSVGM